MMKLKYIFLAPFPICIASQLHFIRSYNGTIKLFWVQKGVLWTCYQYKGIDLKQRHEQIQYSMLIKIQLDATVCRYLFTAKSLYMFRVSQHPSSGVLKTVTTASGTGHNIGTATSLQPDLISTPRSPGK